MDMEVKLELTDTDLETIKNNSINSGKQFVHWHYIKYLLDNSLEETSTEPSKEFHKFDFPARDKLRNSVQFEQINKSFMISDFIQYLIRTNKIAVGILKFGEDYYLDTAIVE